MDPEKECCRNLCRRKKWNIPPFRSEFQWYLEACAPKWKSFNAKDKTALFWSWVNKCCPLYPGQAEILRSPLINGKETKELGTWLASYINFGGSGPEVKSLQRSKLQQVHLILVSLSG